MAMGTFSGIALSLPFMKVPSLLRLPSETNRVGLGACFGMGGCRHLVLVRVVALGWWGWGCCQVSCRVRSVSQLAS